MIKRQIYASLIHSLTNISDIVILVLGFLSKSLLNNSRNLSFIWGSSGKIKLYNVYSFPWMLWKSSSMFLPVYGKRPKIAAYKISPRAHISAALGGKTLS